MNETTITSKGQILIPQALRKKHNLKPNSKALWVDGGSILYLVPRVKNPLEKIREILADSDVSVEDFLTERRRDKLLEKKKKWAK